MHCQTPTSTCTAPQIASNKRYAGNSGWTVSECAAKVSKDIGKIDILVRECVEGGYTTVRAGAGYQFCLTVASSAPWLDAT
jgi:hypothetical protein